VGGRHAPRARRHRRRGRLLRISDAATGTLLGDRLRVADSHWTRLKGLLGTSSLDHGEGLWLKPCRQIHMIGMRYPIDAAFLDADHCVVEALQALAPGTLSPKVASATSVVELPAGTLARAGVVTGSRLAITRELETSAQIRIRIRAVAAIVGNVSLALLYLAFALAHVGFARRTGQWLTTMPLVLQETMLVVLFLTRRASAATSAHGFDWAIGVLGVVIPLFMRASESPGRAVQLGELMQVAGLGLAVLALASLGRSLGVVPANRGVKTTGMYGLIRHPTYAAYMLSYAGYVASNPSLRNGLLAAATTAAFFARAHLEERFLRRDESYRSYLHRVRWRFVPHLY
jgi:protein-S-isoprenylcysteine O-methyltransferase Ste14/uncharacterized membrane protein (UPF0127 family)